MRPLNLLVVAPLGLACLIYTDFARAQTNDNPSGTGAVPGGAAGAIPVRAQPSAQAAAQAASPPQLKQFVPATYPPEAEKQGLEGNVVLQLDINVEGKVTGALVVNPAGHGFDEAAAEAARNFIFEPARKDGRAIPARILYRYSFTLRAKDPADNTGKAPEKPKGPVKNLSGSIRSSAGDVPLAGVNVVLKDTLGRERSFTTNEEGAWAFEDLPPGFYTITIKTEGYQPLEVQEQVSANEATEAVYRLAAEGAVEVVIRGKRPPREVTKRTLEQREISRIPGTNGDALRSIQNLPGVARPPGLAGLLIVRGSAPTDTEVYIDNTLVPLVYHFGGLSSVVPTELIERIDFYPGNFSAQFGRVTGGIVDVGLRSPRNDGKYHGMAQLDLIDARAMLEGPVPYVKGWTFAAAVRRSWVDLWLKPVLTSAGASVTSAPVYYDYQVMAETKPNSRSRFRASFIGSDDRLEVLTREASEQDATFSGNIKLRTGFWRVMADYRNDFSDKLSFKTVTAYGSDKIEFGIGSLFFILNNRPLTNKTELSYKIAQGATLHSGLDIYTTSYEVDVRAPQPPRAGEPNPGPFASRPPMQVKLSDTAYRPAGYAELELTPHQRLKIVPGFRVDYAKDTQAWDLSPRFNARYILREEFPRTTLKGGFGVYHAPPQFQETAPPFGTRGLRSNRAIHYSLGFEQELSKQVELSVEGFYKDLDRLVSRAPDETGGQSYNNLGAGSVVGSEILLKYRPDSRFFGWLAYTLSRSVRRDSPKEAEYLFRFDQTHILTMLGSYRLGRGWEFGARYRLISGNLYTPFLGGIYSANAGSYAGISAQPSFSDRLPMFNQLDLRVDKRWDYGTWKLSTYLDVQNVYYSQNVEGYSYNYNFTQKTPITGLPIIPSIGVRGEF